MIEMRLDTSGLLERARVSKRMLVEGNRKSVHEASIEGADYARGNHRHVKRTGRLTGSEMFARIVATNDRMTMAEIRNEVDYAWFVEYGTPPHRIMPKTSHGFIGPLPRGQSRREITDIGTHRVALRWYVGGRAVFAPYVDHPGTEPFPFVEPAAEYATLRINVHNESVLLNLARYWET